MTRRTTSTVQKLPFEIIDLRNVLPHHPTINWSIRSLSSIDRIVVHHTATEIRKGQTVRQHIEAINRNHIRNNGWPGIPYHFVIGYLGKVFQCCSLEQITFHSGNKRMNRRSIAICFLGNLTYRTPTVQQLKTYAQLLAWLKYPAIGHRDVVSTICPGGWWVISNRETENLQLGEETMDWMQVPITEVMSQRDAEIWAANMQLWRPTSIPEGETYYKLTRIDTNIDGTMNVYHHMRTVEGAPIPQIAICQGWRDGDPLPSDSIPQGGDPRGYPNRGGVSFSNANGVCEFVWGPGEGFDPASNEGPHWFWVAMGPAAYWSDVCYGWGWRWGTNHDKLTGYWTLYEGDTPPPPPDDGEDVVAAIDRTTAAINHLTDVLQSLKIGIYFG